MSNYALVPLLAIIAYIPLLATAVSHRPWQRRQTLFVLFLLPALFWSLFDYLLRGSYFPEYTLMLGKIVMILGAGTFVQYHLFLTSFYGPGRGKWLPFAYTGLAIMLLLVLLGFIPESIDTVGGRLVPNYGRWMIVYITLTITLTSRDFYVLFRRLKDIENPALYNQVVSLLLGLGILITLALSGAIPFVRHFPTVHLGNMINAIILSYAVMRHQLVDIKIMLRQGTAIAVLGFTGAAAYLLLLIVSHNLFGFNLDMTVAVFATVVALAVGLLLYRLRGYFFNAMNRALQGESYNYRWQLTDFANSIQNVFNLRTQGRQLLELVTRALDIKQACLLFPSGAQADFGSQILEPAGGGPLFNFNIRNDNPILEYLRREQRILRREELAIKPEFLSLWERERWGIDNAEIELFVPLISRDKLIAVLVLGKKKAGRYSLEDVNLLEDVARRVAVSVEKEFLRERLREREEELSVLNRSGSIITSSLDIQGIFSSFIDELKKLVDISLASITMVEGDSMRFLAITPESMSPWKVGETVPAKGTMTQWVVTNKKPLVEPDLSKESKFSLGKFFTDIGAVSAASFPLIAKGEAIGSLIIASNKPNAYSEKHIMFLEQAAFQIAMSVENARLYANAEEMARVDELTGLLNRRSLSEALTSEIGRHSRYGGLFSIIIIDLDSFKAFNDNYGHLAGDRLLKQVGGIIKGAIRNADQAFRYGGDEFCVLLPQTAIDAAKEVAERVRRQIALRVKAGDIPITASLGLASWPADGITSNQAIEAADAALYHAKRGGGNRSHCASGTLLPLEDLAAGPRDSEDNGILGTIYALAATADSRGNYSDDHSKRVSEYAIALAQALNMKPQEINRLETCALLHDIGKIGISYEILSKPDKLTVKEWAIIKTHPHLGATIVSRSSKLAPCVPGILYHHERWDGSGYPSGLKGEDIPLDARLMALVDSFVAMTSERAYSDALSQEDALEEMKRCAGTQFDPLLVEVFSSVVKAGAAPPEEKVRGGGII